jgi:hypothetical protein
VPVPLNSNCREERGLLGKLVGSPKPLEEREVGGGDVGNWRGGERPSGREEGGRRGRAGGIGTWLQTARLEEPRK